MSPSARVTAIDALIAWKTALCLFQEAAEESLVAADMEIRRTGDWLDERRKFWEDEVRRREDGVVHAKAELTRKKMMPIIGKHPDTTEEEKNLRRAVARLEEAEAKVKKTRKWVPVYQRAVEEYHGISRRLGSFLELELARGITLMEHKIAALEAYVAIEPLAQPPLSIAPPAPEEGTA
jgi:hypothetical protein